MKWTFVRVAILCVAMAAQACGDVARDGADAGRPSDPGVGDDSDAQRPVRCELSGDWETIEEYFVEPGHDSRATGAGIDSAGNLYVSGYDGMSGRWITRKRTLDGTWSVVDTYAYPGGAAYARSLHVDAQDRVWVGGIGAGPSGLQHWIIRSSRDAGATWTTVDDRSVAGSTRGANVGGIASDGGGAVYAAGYFPVIGDQDTWTVRKTTDGSTWTTVDTFQLVPSTSCRGHHLAVAPNGDVFAVGACESASGLFKAVARHSSDGGASWRTADEFSNVRHTGAGAVTATNASVTVVANGNDGQDVPVWMSRRSVDGLVWSDFDRFQLQPTGEAIPIAALATRGVVFIAGFAQLDGRQRWIVRRSDDDGIAWGPEDSYEYAPGGDAVAHALAFDDRIGLVAVGFASSTPTGPRAWIVRRLSCR